MGQREGEAMEARVLGAISVTVAGERVVEGSTKLAGLFALLVTTPGCTVAVDDIAHCLWEGENASPNQISERLRALRKLLDGKVSYIKSRKCSLYVPWESVDILRFREWTGEANGLWGRDRFEKFGTALAQWPPGEPLQGLKGNGFEVRRSELRMERQRTVRDQLHAAYLADEIDWLRRETEVYSKHPPRDEDVFRIWLLAHAVDLPLPRRKAVIKRWSAQFGQPQNPELKLTVEDLLRPASRSPRRTLGREAQVPRQLPSAGRPLLGREAQLAELEDAFVEARKKGRGVLAVLSGMAGVGKTTMADHLAARIAGHYPDGALYSNLQGFSEGADPVDPEQLIERFLADLGVETRATDLEGKSVALRSALASRSVLMVLDNAAHSGQVLPLLPGEGACAVLVTSRSTLTGLHAKKEVLPMQIDLVDTTAAAEILTGELDQDQRRKCGHYVADLVELCGRLPMALFVISRQLGLRTPSGVRALVEQLREERTRLQAMHLSENELSVRVALECSFRTLSPEAALLIWQAAIHPGPTISWAALQDLGRVSGEGNVPRAIGELVDAHLMERLSDDYRMHDLVRVYARHHAEERIEGASPALAQSTVRQVLEHHLHRVWRCDQAIVPGRELPIGDPVDVEPIPSLSREGEAMELLDAEYPTTMEVVRLAMDHRLDRHVWLLSMALVTYQWRRNLHADAQSNLNAALAVAADITTSAEAAMIHRMLAGSLHAQRSHDLAAWHLFRAVSLSEQDGGDVGRLSLAHSLHALATICRVQGEPVAAAEHGERALEIFRCLGDRAGEAAALNGLGTLHHDHGEYDDALRACTEALRIFETTRDLNGTANVLSTLGKIHHSRSEPEAALAAYGRAVALYRDLGYWRNEATSLRRYAALLVSSRDVSEAVKALERALVLLERLGGEEAQDVADLLANLR